MPPKPVLGLIAVVVLLVVAMLLNPGNPTTPTVPGGTHPVGPTSSTLPPDSAEDVDADELVQISTKALKEVSGLASSRRHPGVIWVHNDGDKGLLFALSVDGDLQGRFKLEEGVLDTEDIAIAQLPGEDEPLLFFGDIGDNERQRISIAVMVCPEPELEGKTKGKPKKLESQRLTFSYPDGKYDSEALLVDPIDRQIVVVTKEQVAARVFAAPIDLASDATESQVLRPIATLGVARVSAGDISSDGRWIALRNEETGWLWRRRDGESLEAALRRPPLSLPVLSSGQAPNGESLAFVPDGSGYMTVSEGRNEAIALFSMPVEAQE